MDKLIEQAHELNESILSQSGKLKFDFTNKQQTCCVCLHGTIIEHSSAIILLLKNKIWSPIPSLLRTTLEAFVDLKCLVQDNSYLSNMILADLHEKKKLISKAIETGHTNLYLEGISKIPDIDRLLASVISEIKELSDDNAKYLKIWKRFKTAKLEDLYTSVYADLCQHCHNNLSKLQQRHLVETNGQFHINYFRIWDAPEIMKYIETVSGITFDSIKLTSEFLNVSDDLETTIIEAEFDKLSTMFLASSLDET